MTRQESPEEGEKRSAVEGSTGEGRGVRYWLIDQVKGDEGGRHVFFFFLEELREGAPGVISVDIIMSGQEQTHTPVVFVPSEYLQGTQQWVETQLSHFLNHLNNLYQENEQIKQQQQWEIVREAQVTFQQLYETNDQHRQAFHAMKGELEDLQAKHRVLRQEMVKKEEELSELRQVNSQQTAEIELLKEQYAALKSSVEGLSTQIHAMQAQNEKDNEQLGSALEDIFNLQESLTGLADRVEQLPSSDFVLEHLEVKDQEIMDRLAEEWQLPVSGNAPAEVPTVGIVNPTFDAQAEDQEPVGIQLPTSSAQVEQIIPPVVPATVGLRANHMNSRLGSPMSSLQFLNAAAAAPPMMQIPVSADLNFGAVPKALKLPTPAKFNGNQDPLTWIKSLELYFQLVGLHSAKQQILFAMTLIEGGPALWATSDHAQQNRLVDLTWHQFCHELIGQFSVGDREIGARDQLRTLRFTPHSDFNSFIQQLRGCFMKIAGITDSQKIEYLENSLPPDMLTFIRSHRVPGIGFDTLVTMLIHQANILKSTQYQGGTLPSLCMARNNPPKEVNAVAASSSKQQNFQDMLNARPCAYCNGTSHCARFCFKLVGKDNHSKKKTPGKGGGKKDAVSVSSA